MTIREFIKKLMKEEKPQSVIKNTSLQELPKILDSESKEISAKSEGLRKNLSEKATQLSMDLESESANLKKISLEKKKEDPKIKLIVEENLKFYTLFLEKLAADLESLKEESLKSYVKKLQDIISNFDRSSRNNFEKATILVGQVARSKELIRALISEINSLVQDNRALFERADTIQEIKKSLLELEKVSESEKEIESLIKKIKEIISHLESQKSERGKEAEKIEAEPGFRQEKEKKMEREQEQSRFSQEISNLKEKINLRFLAKHFHSDAKKSRLIQAYSENFLKALEKDESLELERLVKEAKNLDINLKEIRDKHEQLSLALELALESRKQTLEQEIKSLDSKISVEKARISDEEKKAEKMRARYSEILEEIKEISLNIDINLS